MQVAYFKCVMNLETPTSTVRELLQKFKVFEHLQKYWLLLPGKDCQTCITFGKLYKIIIHSIGNVCTMFACFIRLS